MADNHASRGGPRNPLPSRSMTRKMLRAATELVTSRMTFASVENPYPASAKILRLPVLSDSQPAT
jgi:hypothetical protein